MKQRSNRKSFWNENFDLTLPNTSISGNQYISGHFEEKTFPTHQNEVSVLFFSSSNGFARHMVAFITSANFYDELHANDILSNWSRFIIANATKKSELDSMWCALAKSAIKRENHNSLEFSQWGNLRCFCFRARNSGIQHDVQ